MTTTFGSVLVKNRTGHPVLFFLHISIASTKRFFEHKKNGVKPLENKNTNHVSHMAEARLHSSLTIMISYLNLCVKKKRTGWFFLLFFFELDASFHSTRVEVTHDAVDITFQVIPGRIIVGQFCFFG